MNKEHIVIAENIITKIKSSKSGLTSLMQITMVVDNPNTRSAILESLISDFGLVTKVGNDFRLTKKGFDFKSFSDLKQDELNLKERERIEFEKSKTDLELSKETLKDFPKTKKRARVGYLIAIILAIAQLAEWIIKLISKN
jgi:predicted methyltransferase